MQIVRIEHSDGWGIFRTQGYRPNVSDLGLDALIHRHWDFPTPAQEGEGEYIRENQFCAFKTIEQVQQWIMPDEIRILLENDFRVYLLEVSNCIVYEYQCVYEKENIIEQKDISELFK